jgi:hypothetical protein
MRQLSENGILLIAYALHTSHIFQVFDILSFEKLNRRGNFFSKN